MWLAGVRVQVGYGRCLRPRGGKVSAVASNVLDRQFSWTAPERAWVSDITYMRTCEGWLFLAVAVAESYFQLLKRERIRRRIYPTRDAVRADLFDCMEMYYNPKRQRSANDSLSPVQFKHKFVRIGSWVSTGTWAISIEQQRCLIIPLMAASRRSGLASVHIQRRGQTNGLGMVTSTDRIAHCRRHRLANWLET